VTAENAWGEPWKSKPDAHLTLFGHNSDLTDLADDLGSDIDNIQTCRVVEMRFDIDAWIHVGHIEPACVDSDYPKKVLW
jgi:phosphohistidine phosphatase